MHMKAQLLVAGALVAIWATAAPAQSKTGTTIGQFANIEPSARVTGMGNAGAAMFEGIQSVYYNASSLGEIENPALFFTHSAWFADISYDFAALALPVQGWGTFYGSLTALNSGDIDVRTVERPLGTGERYSVNDLALGLGFGRRLTQRVSAGVQVNLLSETIYHSSFNVITISAGTNYKLTESGMRIGASLSNFGTQAQFGGRDLAIQYDGDPDRFGDNGSLPANQLTDEFPVPVQFRVGLAMPYVVNDASRFLFAVDAFHPNNNSESVSLGGEWSWKNTLALRAGYQRLFQEDSELGLTLGFGLQGIVMERGFALDYAWADHERLDETHRFSFVVSF